MLTSVLNERELTAAQIAKFYKMRWGIETNHAHYDERFTFSHGNT
jgi:hypothetical protein